MQMARILKKSLSETDLRYGGFRRELKDLRFIGILDLLKVVKRR